MFKTQRVLLDPQIPNSGGATIDPGNSKGTDNPLGVKEGVGNDEAVVKPSGYRSDAPAIPEHLKGKTFSIEDSDELAGDNIDEEDDANSGARKSKKEDTEKIVQTKKDEQKSDDEKNAKSDSDVEKKSDTSTLGKLKEFKVPDKGTIAATQKTKTVEHRDYSIFPEDKREMFKNVSNEVFSYLKENFPKWQQQETKLRETEKQLVDLEQNRGMPKEWFNHPQAFTLHPEYQNLITTHQQASFEANFWQDQLTKIESNQPYRILRGYNTQTGDPVYSDELQPTPEAKSNAILNMQKANGILGQVVGDINELQQHFSGMYSNAARYVDNIINDKWPWFKNDPKDPRHAVVGEFMKAVPDEFHSHPATKAAALLYSDLMRALEYITELETNSNIKKTIQEEKRKIEPTVGSPSISSGGKTIAAINGKFGGKYQPPETFSVEDL